MNQFYVPVDQVSNHTFTLTGQEARHAAKVLRYKEGDEITAVDGRGSRYSGTIQIIAKSYVEVAIEHTQKVDPPVPNCIIAMGMIKKRQRLEFAVEKLVELGASEIILFESQRTERSKIRIDRLEGKAQSAMKQSLRAWLPDINVYHSVEEVLEQYGSHPTYIAHEKVAAEKPSTSLIKRPQSILMMVGPEGGFTEGEIDLAKAYGAECVSLGPYRLRTETAAIYMASLLLTQTPFK